MSTPRFLTLTDVAETLNISMSQARAMVRSGELPAIQVGGRGQWRVEKSVLEDYIEQAYRRTAASIREHQDTQG
ncbi:helix-turn-helix domain-containing protein [Rothia kristinae]|uniref:DNA-binding protein n=1 Tax=Rothia kristinae TaxID=37923 RepID=A0A1S2N149_9MICC|nr:helix-turn-helix domain-containing protein [Rothia kristinae]MBE8527775.1 helix-turn-helix domain-containing protein [Amycolatopsis sp. H6(2020)]MDN5639512.1 helix-turn-helix domain-containing protein [Actinomycetes bacterium]OIJ36443.1 DNA-binding protein [Rothia kristinae]QQC59310.1 helix-turn-helix domain-containing protein [Rothia kristinae]